MTINNLSFPMHPGIRVRPTPTQIFNHAGSTTQTHEYCVEYNAESAPLVIALWKKCKGRFGQFLFEDPNSRKSVWARFDSDELQDFPVVAGKISVVTLVDSVEG